MHTDPIFLCGVPGKELLTAIPEALPGFKDVETLVADFLEDIEKSRGTHR